MEKKTLTITNEKGEQNEYNFVAYRLQQFWVKNPKGEIATELIKNADNIVIFKATIKRQNGGTATGHASSEKIETVAVGHASSDKTETKEFEKIETVAVGRALANLGYAASAQIASADEMELKGKALVLKHPVTKKAVKNSKVPIGSEETITMAIRELKKARSIKAVKTVIAKYPNSCNQKSVIDVIRKVNKKFKK